MKTLRQRCTAIELLIVDVDGVLTAGGIVYGNVAESLRDSEGTRGASAPPNVAESLRDSEGTRGASAPPNVAESFRDSEGTRGASAPPNVAESLRDSEGTRGASAPPNVAKSLRDSEGTRGASAPHSELEIKQFHVRDGSGLKLWHRAGKRTALLTGRTSPVVERRAAELGIERVVQGAADKEPAYRNLLSETGLPDEAVCYVGDDVPDVPLLRICGLAVAVADACPEARALAHYLTHCRGGHGAVREAIELILRCQERWNV